MIRLALVSPSNVNVLAQSKYQEHADLLQAVALTCDAWFRPCHDKLVPLLSERDNHTLSGSQLQGWEWSRYPDYWDNQYPWHGYIPQLDSPVSLGPHAWVFVSDSASNQVVKDPSSTRPLWSCLWPTILST